MTIDQALTLDDHVVQTCRSCYFALFNLRRIRPCLDVRTCTMAVQALVISRLDQRNALLVGATNKNFKMLQRVQNMAARTIFNLRKNDHISNSIRSLHWLPVEKRVISKVLFLTWKCLHGLAPQYLRSLLSIRESSHNTRSSQSLTLSVPRTELVTFGDRAFSNAAPRLWNALPASIRDIQNISVFKKSLKTHLFN